MGLTVGIDLGTTYSVVAYIDQTSKKPVIIKNKYGENTTPSVIGFHADGSYEIGADAKGMEEAGDVNTASFYKLHMGDAAFKVSFYGREYTAMDLSAFFLSRLVEDAEKRVGTKITHAVITVPAYFDDLAKSDTLKAGEKAGLHVINIISEPTAACVAYGLNEDGRDRKILIYDLGGGTFDVTIADIKKDAIDVMGTNGDHHLGGRDWDFAVADWLTQKFLEETGIDISEDNETVSANMIKAENAKKQLSSVKTVDITVDNGEKKCKFQLTRGEFEGLTSYYLDKTIALIDQTFEEINIGWKDLDGAVLVGGSTKMPMVRGFIQDNGIPILEGVHPDEAVAIGAAIQANISIMCAVLPGDREKSSLSLVGSADKLNLQLLPGAKMIRDVISHSLGMIMVSEDETRYINDIMIRRNTPFDQANITKRRELRVSRRKERNMLDLYLLQGESDCPTDCTIAKRYVFYGIDYVEGGKSRLDITFQHTYNGIIDISAIQTETGAQLKYREEPIPEDMSWLEESPQEQNDGSGDSGLRGALIMALDVSGSMSWENAIDKAKAAMDNFVDQFEECGIAIGIMAFSNGVKETCSPTTDMGLVHQAIQSIIVSGIDSRAPENANCELGSGNSASPMDRMYEELRKMEKKIDIKPKPKGPMTRMERLAQLQGERRNDNSKFMYAIVLTDGVWDKSACANAVLRRADFVREGYEIVGMGFGSADINFLKKISTRDDLAKVDNIASLNENLSTIAKVINQ